MSLPPDLRRFARSNPGGNLIVTPELERVVTERILEEIEPLSKAGKFGAVSPAAQSFVLSAQAQAR